LTITYGAKRASDRFFTVFCLSIFAITAGVAVNVGQTDAGAAFVVAGFSLIWLSLGGHIWVAGSDPIRLVAGRFDEQARKFVLTAADGATCALPYRELDRFDVRCHVTTGKRKYVSYIVYVLKRDGGFWDLQSFGEDGPAQELLRSLQGSVSLAAPHGEVSDEAGPLPDVFRRADVDGTTRFTWKNQGRARDSLVGALIGAGMIMMLVGIPGIMTGAHWLFWGLSGAIILWIGRRIYRAHGRSFQLEISERFLTYSTRERGGAGFQVKRVLEVEQLARLQSLYVLQRIQQERSHQLTFVSERHAPRLQARRLEQDKFETVQSAAKLDRAIIELDLPGIRTSDVLMFEAHLQAELARRGHAVA
jgi:hypothetical protein